MEKKKGTFDKKRYEKAKAEVFAFELRNRSKLVAFRSTAGWWKLGGTSALLYYHRVAPRLGLKPNLKADGDFYSKFEEGVISIKDINRFEENLKKLGIERIKSGTSMRMYDLGITIDAEEIKRLKKNEEAERKKFNKLVLPKVVLPDVYVGLCNINKAIYENVRLMTPPEREYAGMEMAVMARKMLEKYILMANGKLEKEETLAELLEKIEILIADLKIALETKIWPTGTCLRISATLIDMKKILEKEYGTKK